MPGRVLIVDPLSTNRIVLRVRLSAAFHDVAQAATGQEALDCLADTGAALAVIAADLPDMGGIALCRRIRARHPAGSLPIVMIARTRAPTPERMEMMQEVVRAVAAYDATLASRSPSTAPSVASLEMP